MAMFLKLMLLCCVPFFAMANDAMANDKISGLENSSERHFAASGYGETQGGVSNASAIKANGFVSSFVDLKIDNETKVRGNFAASVGSAAYESRGSAMAIDDAFISYKNLKYGEIEAGITHPVTEKFRKDAATIARGSGGINGDYFRYIAYGLDSSNMILSPQMPTAGGFATSNYIGVQNNLGTLQNYFNGARGAKISAISNSFAGFKFGASFTPSLYDKYTAIGSSQNDLSNLQDVVNNFNTKDSLSLGLNYQKEITTKLNISISGLYEVGKAERLSQAYAWRERENLKSWSFGGNLQYENWHFGGSYINYGKSLFFKEDGTANTMAIASDGSLSSFGNSYLYNAGISYAKENWGVSSSYFRGNYMNNESEIVNISFDKTKKTAFGKIMHYVEFAHVSVVYPNYYKNTALQINNKTSTFAIFGGVRLFFEK